MEGIWILLFVSAAFWYWWDSYNAQELANQVANKRCEELDLQFLDGTVAMQKLKLARDDMGRMQLSRLFIFEFTNEDETRYEGSILIVGKKLVSLEMDPYKIIE